MYSGNYGHYAGDVRLSGWPPRGDCAEHRRLETHFESALMSVVRKLMLSGLNPSREQMAVAPELVAETISGAIYGGVSEWARTPDRGLVEDAVKAILLLVGPMLHPQMED